MDNKIIKFYVNKNDRHQVKWVLFDCFDTILHRKMNTENIKMLWASQICSRFGWSVSPCKMYQIRKEAEDKVSIEKGIIRKEFTYWNLMEQIYLKLTFLEDLQINLEEMYNIALQIEMDLESQYCYVDEEAKEAICFFVKNSINMAIVSDFYISGKVLAELLNKYSLDCFACFFISCDYNAGKYSGELYAHVLSSLNVRAEDVIMIGDNIKSDVHMARKYGIKAFLKQWNKYPKMKDYNMVSEQLLKLSNTRKKNNYENYAFVLYYFIDELYKRVLRDGADEVLFLAREGEFLKELFDAYLQNQNDSSVKTFYFCTSRIASFAAGLRKIEEETFEGLFNKYTDMSIRVFLQSIGWNEQEIAVIRETVDFDIDKQIKLINQSPEFRMLKENAVFIRIYDGHRCEQKEYMNAYLRQMGVNLQTGLHIVDVGWRGSIQDNIYHCFDEKVDIHGYYIGVSKLWCNLKGNYKEGIIFSEYPCKSVHYDIWSFDKFMFERILLASHPTTNGYQLNDGIVTPIYKEFLSEIEAYRYIRPYQNSMKTIFMNILSLFQNTAFTAADFNKEFVGIHLRMLLAIGLREIKMQKELYDYNYESFGEFDKTKVGVVQEVVQAIRNNKVPVRKIIKNGINLKYMQSISLTTYCITHHLSLGLIAFYRLLYVNEKIKLRHYKNVQNYDYNNLP